MYLSILCYKFVCLVDKIVFGLIERGKESVVFVKSISKKLYCCTEPLVRKFCSYFVQNSKK